MTTDAHIARHVLPHRCPNCGHKRVTWSPRAIVEAAIEWAEDHGRPPRANEWKRAAPDRPSHQTVCAVFGSWNAMLEAAGLLVDRTTEAHAKPNTWTRETVANAMLDWVALNGRWPTVREWALAVGADEPARPHPGTVRSIFGTWNAARRYAGWREQGRCDRCGCGLDDRTPGCRSCMSRHNYRRTHGLADAREPVQMRLRLFPAEPFAEAVRSYIGAHGSNGAVAELAGVDDTLIGKLLRGEKSFLREDTAEALAIAIDRPDVLALVAA